MEVTLRKNYLSIVIKKIKEDDIDRKRIIVEHLFMQHLLDYHKIKYVVIMARWNKNEFKKSKGYRIRNEYKKSSTHKIFMLPGNKYIYYKEHKNMDREFDSESLILRYSHWYINNETIANRLVDDNFSKDSGFSKRYKDLKYKEIFYISKSLESKGVSTYDPEYKIFLKKLPAMKVGGEEIIKKEALERYILLKRSNMINDITLTIASFLIELV